MGREFNEEIEDDSGTEADDDYEPLERQYEEEERQEWESKGFRKDDNFESWTRWDGCGYPSQDDFDSYEDFEKARDFWRANASKPEPPPAPQQLDPSADPHGLERLRLESEYNQLIAAAQAAEARGDAAEAESWRETAEMTKKQYVRLPDHPDLERMRNEERKGLTLDLENAAREDHYNNLKKQLPADYLLEHTRIRVAEGAEFGEGNTFYLMPNDTGQAPPRELKPLVKVELEAKDAARVRNIVKQQSSSERKVATLHRELKVRGLLPKTQREPMMPANKDGTFSEEQLRELENIDPSEMSQLELEQWQGSGGLPEWSSPLSGFNRR